MAFRKTDQNGGAHGKKVLQVFKVEKLNQQQEKTIKLKPFTLNQIKQL